MTASFAQVQPARSEPTPAAAVTAVIVASVTALTLIVAGITFLALTVAFPIAIPIAQAYNVPVSATDIAVAARFAELWWAFAALAFASFAAVILVVVKVISFLSSRAARLTSRACEQHIDDPFRRRVGRGQLVCKRGALTN